MCFGKTTRGVDRLNSDKKYLVNAEVWTGTGERLKKGVIVLEGGRIAQVGEDVPVPEGAEVIDLAGWFVTPGLIDAHVHMGTYNEVKNRPRKGPDISSIFEKDKAYSIAVVSVRNAFIIGDRKTKVKSVSAVAIPVARRMEFFIYADETEAQHKKHHDKDPHTYHACDVF